MSIRDAECIAFLQWVLPKMGLRWAGFRKPRRQVCRRIRRRLEALGLSDFEQYRRKLTEEGAKALEWEILDSLCRVTISRFWRDRGLWETLKREVLPELVREAGSASRTVIRAWSVGCASGEEPYSLGLLWRFGQTAKTAITLEMIATDVDEHLLERARRAVYPAGCLRELPEAWRRDAFRARGGGGALELREEFRGGVTFRAEDVRESAPSGPFDLVLCRNLAWTYFDTNVQRTVLARIASVLRPGGVLVIGGHEELPQGGGDFEEIRRSILCYGTAAPAAEPLS